MDFANHVESQRRILRVYLQAFPVPAGQRPVSPGPGNDPQWAPDGRTLYYRDGVTFFAVDVTTDPSFAVVSPPRRLFDYPGYATSTGGGRFDPHWDVHPDGTRFILTEATVAAPGAAQRSEESLSPTQRLQDVYIVTNWFTELRRLIPD